MLPYYRPPYGARNPATDRRAAAAGFPYVVLWDTTASDTTRHATVADVVRGRHRRAVRLHRPAPRRSGGDAAGPAGDHRALPGPGLPFRHDPRAARGAAGGVVSAVPARGAIPVRGPPGRRGGQWAGDRLLAGRLGSSRPRADASARRSLRSRRARRGARRHRPAAARPSGGRFRCGSAGCVTAGTGNGVGTAGGDAGDDRCLHRGRARGPGGGCGRRRTSPGAGGRGRGARAGPRSGRAAAGQMRSRISRRLAAYSSSETRPPDRSSSSRRIASTTRRLSRGRRVVDGPRPPFGRGGHQPELVGMAVRTHVRPPLFSHPGSHDAQPAGQERVVVRACPWREQARAIRQRHAHDPAGRRVGDDQVSVERRQRGRGAQLPEHEARPRVGPPALDRRADREDCLEREADALAGRVSLADDERSRRRSRRGRGPCPPPGPRQPTRGTRGRRPPRPGPRAGSRSATRC